MSRDNR
jgi:hypothetical protein